MPDGNLVSDSLAHLHSLRHLSDSITITYLHVLYRKRYDYAGGNINADGYIRTIGDYLSCTERNSREFAHANRLCHAHSGGHTIGNNGSFTHSVFLAHPDGNSGVG
jgi:hypothetical protein